MNMNMNKCQNMLLGIAIGDAFGAGYEFAYKSREELADNFDFTKYGKSHFPKTTHFPGMYTDDTQMSIAISELLLSGKDLNKENFADYFLRTFKRDPIQGYARGFQAFLESVESGSEFLEKIKPHSKRNGAAMRSVPLGLQKNVADVISSAIENAKTTHDTPKGIASSLFIGLMSHNIFYDRYDFSECGELLIPVCSSIDKEFADYLSAVNRMKGLDSKLLLGDDWKDRGVPCDGMRTAGAVFYVLKNFGNNPKETLRQAVLLGGDTDSTASIALGISAIKNGLDDLPDFLLKDLTNRKYGKDYLLELGDKLSEVYE